MSSYYIVRRKLKDGGSVPINLAKGGAYCTADGPRGAIKFHDYASAVHFQAYMKSHGPKLVAGQVDETDIAEIPDE